MVGTPSGWSVRSRPTSNEFFARSQIPMSWCWWGPMDVRTSVAEIDLRVGGECRLGDASRGTNRRPLRPDRRSRSATTVVMTNRWDGQVQESLVTLRLTSVPTGTHLELIHQRLPAGADPLQYRQGWHAALASLNRHLSQERDRQRPPMTLLASRLLRCVDQPQRT